MPTSRELRYDRLIREADTGRGRSVAVDYSHVLANLPVPEVADYRHAALVVCGHVVDNYDEQERRAVAGELLDALGITGEEWG